MKSKPSDRVEGQFQHLVYSPRGDIEGVLLHVDGAPVQIVFERHDTASGRAFEDLAPGQAVTVAATPAKASPKGEAEHPVYDFVRLVAVDGAAPVRKKAATGAAYQGRIVRFNHARHGAPNGVVLDTGDFIHTKPEGLARLKLKVGDLVAADGDAQYLATGKGWAVEAVTVNRKAVRPA